MKNQQKGFIIPLVVIVIAILAIGGGVYVYKNKKTNVYIPKNINTQFDQNVSSTSTNQVEIKPLVPVQNTQAVSKLTIIYPNGGENIKIGDRVNITWKNSNFYTNSNITIYLIQNLSGCFNLKAGQTCLGIVDPETILASNISNTGVYSWSTANKGNYYIKICAGLEKTASSCDKSDDLFTVVDPVEVADKVPTISSVTGPTNLKVNENGTWTVVATDPEGQKISYSMSVTKIYPVQTNPSKIVGIKPTEAYSSVINWKFDQSGTYMLEFTASDFYGKVATSSMTVNVQ